MREAITPLTTRQLIGYVNSYLESFPDWSVENDVVLARSHGPLKQRIAFEALRSGAYRPSCSVAVLTAPDGQLLFRYLDIKHREILPRQHSSRRSLVLRAMEEQFLPSIREPLNVAKVLHLAEEEVLRDRIAKTNDSVALAALYVHVGNLDRAKWWCDQVPLQLASLGREPARWEQAHARYAEQLRDAVVHGRAESFLQMNLGS